MAEPRRPRLHTIPAHRGFADAGRVVVRQHEVHLDGRRRLPHADQGIRVEVLRHDLAAFDRQVQRHRLAERARVVSLDERKNLLRLQLEGRGYSFIEVLAECPTHLRLSPVEAEKWVQEKMEPIFPLGVKKDVTRDPWFKGPQPGTAAGQ